MRKVKVLAFVLAALMVVAAFAGCGTKQLKTDVSTLDERVTALEELLKQVNSTVNNAATAGQIEELLEAITANKAEAAAGDKALADAIAKITADQTAANDKLKTDLEKLVNDVKADQKTGDTALQVAIEKLTNSLADTNKALADSVADLLDEIKDGDEDLTDAIADTNKALADAIAAINKAQDAQGKDVADALAATNKALEDAMKALQESTKANDDAIREDLRDAIDAITAAQNKQGEDLTKALEESNKALSDALKELQDSTKANDDAIRADLTAAIEAITAAQNKQGEDLAAALKETNDALAAAIESLKDEIKTGDDAVRAELIAAIEALTQKQEEQNNAIAEALAGLKETIEQNKEEAGANASVQAAISKYVSDLTVAKTGYDFDEIHYTDADFTAINKAISTGIAAVQAATTVEAAKAAYDVAVAELAKYERVDVALYAAYTALRGKVTTESWDAIEAYENQAAAAKKHYTAKGDVDIVAHYQYASNKYYNLVVDEVNALKDAYRYLVNTLVPRMAKLVKAIDAIGSVQFYDIVVDGEKVVANVTDITAANKDYTNSSSPYGIKDIITNTNTSRTDVRKHGLYIADSMLDLVTNYKTLSDYISTVNALTKAEAMLATYANTDNKGAYLNVFAEYVNLDTNRADDDTTYKRDWFNAESAFNKVNARIDSWLEDNPAVDANNAKAIIDKYLDESVAAHKIDFDYDKYCEDEAVMELYAAAYSVFKNEFVPRIKNIEKIKEISTENIQTYIELYKEIEDWKIVIADSEDDADEEPELVVDDAQYAQMCTSALNRNYDFKFDAAVKDFFEGDVATAQEIAAIINKEIDRLEADAKTVLSLAAFKRLEGYTYNSQKSVPGAYDVYNSFVEPDDVEVEAAGGKVAWVEAKGVSVNVAQYAFAFTYSDEYYSYDLTYLLDLDELAAAEKTVEERIATYETLTSKIVKGLESIKVSLAAANKIKAEDIYDLPVDEYNDLLASVNLNNETAVKALKADYTALVTKGYRPDTTRTWVASEDGDGNVIEGEFKDARLMPNSVVYEITGLVDIVEDLRTMANNVVKFMGQVASANKFKAFTVKNMDEHLAVTSYTKSSVTYTDPATGKDKTETTHKWGYLKNTPSIGDRVFNIASNTATDSAYNKDAQPKRTLDGKTDNIKAAYTQFEAVAKAWEAYYAFLEDNQGNTDAAVEAALATNGMEALRFNAIKALAYNAVYAVAESAAIDWKPEFGEYDVQKAIQLAAIEQANSLEVVADILHGFYEMTGVAYGEIKFVDVPVIHADGTLHYVVEDGCPNCGK